VSRADWEQFVHDMAGRITDPTFERVDSSTDSPAKKPGSTRKGLVGRSVMAE
jgi:hypothetical protein